MIIVLAVENAIRLWLCIRPLTQPVVVKLKPRYVMSGKTLVVVEDIGRTQIRGGVVRAFEPVVK